MKICPICQQTYTDDELNYCLSDGGVLTPTDAQGFDQTKANEAPPTVMMNQARTTNEGNWSNQDPFSAWQSQPLQPSQQNAPFQPPPQNMAFTPAHIRAGSDQTLPTIGLVLGILSLLLICCYGGFYFGIAALVIGFLGMNNANKNPSVYGGKNFAIIGMVLGGISLAINIIFVIIAILGNIR